MSREYESRRLIPPSSIRVPAHTVYQDFEGSSYYTLSGTGNDYLVRKSPERVLAGNYGLEIRPKETTPTAEDYVYARFYFPLIAFNIVDVSTDFLVRLTPHDFIVQIDFHYGYTSATKQWLSGVRINIATGEVWVLSAVAEWTPVATLGDLGIGKWQHLSLATDFFKKKYASITVGGYTIDVSDYDLVESGLAAFTPNVRIYAMNVSTNRAQIFYDNIVIAGHTA